MPVRALLHWMTRPADPQLYALWAVIGVCTLLALLLARLERTRG